MTEKLLLHGDAIREAGTVKARGKNKFAKSDWMEIEKQRGISVTSSVMQFEYDDKVVSIMDTPGHNDFGEDTYRILTSVDSAVMVIDAAKGVEAQTVKLFKVCSMREIPLAFTVPASRIAPPCSSSFSVNVVLPASGCEIIPKIRRF